MEDNDEALVSTHQFVVDSEAWDRFMELLDKPPEPSPALIALLAEQEGQRLSAPQLTTSRRRRTAGR